MFTTALAVFIELIMTNRFRNDPASAPGAYLYFEKKRLVNLKAKNPVISSRIKRLLLATGPLTFFNRQNLINGKKEGLEIARSLDKKITRVLQC